LRRGHTLAEQGKRWYIGFLVSWERLLKLMDGPRGQRIAVVGDFMVDGYLFGDAERISPEAPVPVLRIVEQSAALGGAGCVAAALAALGDRPLCIGLVGDDADGRWIRERLDGLGAETDGLVVAPDRPTTRKTRLVGLAQHRHRQQLMRIDAEDSSPVPPAVGAELVRRFDALKGDCRAVCIQDYDKGVVTEAVAQTVIAAAKRRGLPVLVDPARREDYGRYRGATIITPNRNEAELVSGQRLGDMEAVLRTAERLYAVCGAETVCVTLDAEGAALIGPDGAAEHVPTRPRDVYDVTGAGDAVLAALAFATARGAAGAEAAALANVIGGLEVEKFGSVPIQRDEVVAELLRLNHERLGKRRTLTDLLPELEGRRARGERIVFTNGCFDLLHRGHVEFLAFCRRQGDVVVVGLNSDASVRRQGKDDDRPLVPLEDRAAVLAGLADVDYVVAFDEPTPGGLIEAVRPDVLVKGEDWAERGVVGREIVEGYGGRVVLAELLPGRSTTALVDRIRDGSDGAGRRGGA